VWQFTKSSYFVMRISKMHTGEKPNKCHMCDKAFIYLKDIKRHTTVHMRDRLYVCHIYDKAFYRSHTHPFNGPLSGTTRKVKPIWILLKQETVSGNGISWAISKSAPRSRQITTPVPHHSVFLQAMPFLSPNQQRQSTEGNI